MINKTNNKTEHYYLLKNDSVKHFIELTKAVMVTDDVLNISLGNFKATARATQDNDVFIIDYYIQGLSFTLSLDLNDNKAVWIYRANN